MNAMLTHTPFSPLRPIIGQEHLKLWPCRQDHLQHRDRQDALQGGQMEKPRANQGRAGSDLSQQIAGQKGNKVGVQPIFRGRFIAYPSIQ